VPVAAWTVRYSWTRVGRSSWWAENLKECMQDFKCWVSPDYGPQFFRFFFTVHRCKSIMLDISHATLAYSVLENFWGLELPRTRTRTRTWKLVLEDPRGQGLPRGQQHWIFVCLSVCLSVTYLTYLSFTQYWNAQESSYFMGSYTTYTSEWWR